MLIKLIEIQDLARVSPFTKLLMTHRDRSQAETDFQDYSEVIGSVAIENNVLNSHHSLETLNLSLQNFGDWKASIDVFEFLDNCILRLVRRPVHYFDLLGSLALHIKNVVSISEYKIDLLLMAVNEQWPFLAKNVSLTSLQGVSLWLARYMEICVLRSSCTGNETYDNGKKKILSQVRDQIRASIEDKPRRRVIEAGWKYALEHSVYEQTVQSATASVEVQITEPDTRIEKEVQKAPTSQVPPGPPPEDEDHPCLTKWSCEDIEDAISDGVVGGLFRCLCSEYPAIRKQAMGNVKTFMMKLEVSWRCDSAPLVPYNKDRNRDMTNGCRYLCSLERWLRQRGTLLLILLSPISLEHLYHIYSKSLPSLCTSCMSKRTNF